MLCSPRLGRVWALLGKGAGVDIAMQHLVSFAFILAYVVLFGVATLLQKPLDKDLGPVDLNVVMGIGMVVSTLPIMLFKHHGLPAPRVLLFGLGVGAMMGIGSLLYLLGLRTLPVTVAATLSIGYIAVTAVLAVIVFHESVTVWKVAGILLTVAGAALLASQS